MYKQSSINALFGQPQSHHCTINESSHRSAVDVWMACIHFSVSMKWHEMHTGNAYTFGIQYVMTSDNTVSA